MGGFERRFLALDGFLRETAWLWRPMPFKERQPAWTDAVPRLSQALLNLTDEQVARLAADQAETQRFLAPYLPEEMAQLESLCALQAASSPPALPVSSHICRDIPGRKLQQIESFANAVGMLDVRTLEWCGGKGHLGRLLSAALNVPVNTLEREARLCAAGEVLAEKARVLQCFEVQDVLALEGLGRYGRHGVVALHACGDLHRKLVALAERDSSVAVHLAPCCYHLSAQAEYAPFTERGELRLSAADRRLAVTETVTSSAREVRQREHDTEWKLGYLHLRENVMPGAAHVGLKPVPKVWLRGSFEDFCRRLAQRDGIALSPTLAWRDYEREGARRYREVVRWSLLRQTFRRALELWLVFDLAVRLENKGYDVSVRTFCSPRITPRNILISARA